MIQKKIVPLDFSVSGSYCAVMFGCDPELFLADDNGHTVGSERVIEEKTLVPGTVSTYVRRDGVQIELNPAPSTCRQTHAGSIWAALEVAVQQAKSKGFSVDTSPVVTVNEEEMARLSAASRLLGCAPSENLYNSSVTISDAAKTSRVRSAGGHIHFGLGCPVKDNKPLIRRMVRVLDVLLGSTMVLVDIDPAQKERRKVYGRAGEFRFNDHGFEYRTLSNFWLRSYIIYSMVFGIARQAIWIAHYPVVNACDELLAALPEDQVATAINENDQDLARINWTITKEWLRTYMLNGEYVTLRPDHLETFEWFLSKGMDHYWPDKTNPLAYWGNHNTGAERFLHPGSGCVAGEMRAAKAKADREAMNLVIASSKTTSHLKETTL